MDSDQLIIIQKFFTLKASKMYARKMHTFINFIPTKFATTTTTTTTTTTMTTITTITAALAVRSVVSRQVPPAFPTPKLDILLSWQYRINHI
jgi:hypothetical protein